MKINPLFLVSVFCAVLAVALLGVVAVQQPFPIFSSTNQNSTLVNVNSDVGGQDSRFLWNNDGLALIAQAVVLFAAAAATLGLSRIDKEKETP